MRQEWTVGKAQLRLGGEPEVAYRYKELRLDHVGKVIPLGAFSILSPMFERAYRRAWELEGLRPPDACMVRYGGFPYVYVRERDSFTCPTMDNLAEFWRDGFCSVAYRAICVLRRMIDEIGHLHFNKVMWCELCEILLEAWAAHFRLSVRINDIINSASERDKLCGRVVGKKAYSAGFLRSQLLDLKKDEVYLAADYGLFSEMKELSAYESDGGIVELGGQLRKDRKIDLALFLNEAHHIFWDNRFAVLMTRLLRKIERKMKQDGQIAGTVDFKDINIWKLMFEGKLENDNDKILQTAPAAIEITEGSMRTLSEGTSKKGIGRGLKGIPASRGAVTGKVRKISNVKECENVEEREIIVIRNAASIYVLLFERIRGMLIERGGTMAHAVNVARSMDIPVIVALGPTVNNLKDGEIITMNGGSGSVIRHYEGRQE